MDLSEEGMRLEIVAAERNRREHLHRYDDNANSYLGPAYWDGIESEGDIVPGVYETVAVAMPRYAYTRPKVRVTGRVASMLRVGDGGMSIAEQITHAMKVWGGESLVKRIRKVALDFHLAYGCYLVRREPYTGYVPENLGVDVYHPALYRLSPKHVFWDPLADEETRQRYMGHGQWMSPTQLDLEIKADPDGGWKKGVIDNLKSDSQQRGTTFVNVKVSRDDIYVRQVWVRDSVQPGFENKKGYHGSIHWFASSASPSDDAGLSSDIQEIRNPQPYYGPSWGPYSLVGGYPAVDGSFPLSPVVATRTLHDEVNNLARKVMKQAKSYRKGVGVPAYHADLAESLETFEDQGFLAVDSDAAARITQIEVGGIARPSMEAVDVFGTMLDRQRGMDSQQMGSTDSSATATSSMIAANSASAIGGYLQSLFEEGTLQALKTVAWYFYSDEQAAIQIGVNVSEADDMDDIWYLPDPGDAPFESLEVEIELNSMAMSGDVQRRQAIMEASTIVQNMAVANAQLGPVVDWSRMAKAALETLNLSQLASTIQFEQAPPPDEGQGGPPAGFDAAAGEQGVGGIGASSGLPGRAGGQLAASFSGVS